MILIADLVCYRSVPVFPRGHIHLAMVSAPGKMSDIQSESCLPLFCLRHSQHSVFTFV